MNIGNIDIFDLIFRDRIEPIRIATNVKIRHYNTPRALLIRLLNNGKTDVVEWITHGDRFLIKDKVKMANIWSSQTLEMPVSFGPFSENEFDLELGGSIVHIEYNTFKLLTLSTELRPYVNDLVKGPVHEWIIKFLLEQTRTDWVQWTDKEALEFTILHFKKFGKMYAHIHNLDETIGSAIIKHTLVGYCLTKVMTKSNNQTYKFNAAWYKREIMKTPSDYPPKRSYDRWRDLQLETREAMIAISRTNFPDLTL